MNIKGADFTNVGRVFVALGIFAYGVQQLIVADFRPQIVPSFPDWLHKYAVFPYITGIFFMLTGLLLSGLFKVNVNLRRGLSLVLAVYFLFCIVVFHLPYLFFIFPHRLYHVGVWSDMLKAVAFSGGAFVMTSSFIHYQPGAERSTLSKARILQLVGRVLFSVTIFLFGYSHFLYSDFMIPMVPRLAGSPLFWTYFSGAALMASAVAISFGIWSRWISLLLALMLFCWVFMVHIPGAVADPYAGNGNRVISAFDALLFCGVALLIASSKLREPRKI